MLQTFCLQENDKNTPAPATTYAPDKQQKEKDDRSDDEVEDNDDYDDSWFLNIKNVPDGKKEPKTLRKDSKNVFVQAPPKSN